MCSKDNVPALKDLVRDKTPAEFKAWTSLCPHISPPKKSTEPHKQARQVPYKKKGYLPSGSLIA